MKFLIVVALAFAIVLAKDLYFRSIEVPVVENEGRITHGKNAKPGEFCYQVGLFFIKRTITEWCGGSLIGNNWVLTAAHCTDHASWATVYLGAIQRIAPEKTYHVPKTDMLTHPDWNLLTVWNDISLIRIPTTSESGTILIVKIPSNNDLKYLEKIAVVSGWGHIKDSDTEALSNTLQYGILEVSPGSDCKEVYKAIFNDDIHICVATPHRVSTCLGDSGDPLVLDKQNLQIGVLSYGSGRGCTVRHPIVFTRVSAYLPWIKLYTGIDY